jgi:hypothetical protein
MQTGAIIAAKQPKLNDIVSVRSLYMPIDPAETEKLFALFDAAQTPRLALAVPKIRRMCESQAQTILRVCQIFNNPETIVVNHMVLIQIIAYAMGAKDSVLDAKLNPCDGIAVTITDMETSWVPYSAPKAA